jgi:hypothetical protein
MDSRRAGYASVPVIASLLLLLLAAPAADAADGCTLTAPATVKVGTPMNIDGSGFPASSTIDISLTLEGGTPDEFPVQSDTSGAFRLSLTPEPEDVGTTTVVATAGTVCTARTAFTVTGATPTPAPTATPAPSSSSAPGATTSPGGDVGGAAGGAASPPRSDTSVEAAGSSWQTSPTLWALALLVLSLGVAGLILTRQSARRSRDR